MRLIDRFRATEDLAETLGEMRTMLRQEQNENLELVERLADLELALEDKGWLQSASEDSDFSRAAIQKIAHMSRLMYLKSPLIRRGVDVQAFYVWGQGVSVFAEHEGVNDVVSSFLNDRQNRSTLFGHQARTLRDAEQQVEGNIFVAMFTDILTGQVEARTIPARQIVDIRSNPDDVAEVWYYVREWRSVDGKPNKRLYPALWFDTKGARPATVDGIGVEWRAPVYHIKTGGLLDMKFGVPEVYPALDWAKAHKEFLEDTATLMKSLSRFAWRLTTKGRKVSDAKARLGSTLSTTAHETNPSPVTGSVFISDPSTELSAIPKSGATISPKDGRELRLMVAAALGLPDTILSGDPDQGNLATAKTLDRPTELRFASRQEMWSDVYKDLLSYVVARSIMAPRGALAGQVSTEREVIIEVDGEDPGVEVTFPQLLERDTVELIKAAVSAATLDGKAPAGTVPQEALARHLMETLGLDNVDDLLADLESQELRDPGMTDVVEALRAVREAAEAITQ